jgi:hypothetical protein
MLSIITPVIASIRHLITAGTTEQQLLDAVARRFPDLSPAQLSELLQAAEHRPSGRRG